jgi:lipopolysaccharide transport system ATP-binding protein
LDKKFSMLAKLMKRWRTQPVCEAGDLQDAWPADGAFHLSPEGEQLSDGKAVCVRCALCDAEREPCKEFPRGAPLHIFAEFEVRQAIGAPVVTFDLGDGVSIVELRSTTLQQAMACREGPVQSGRLLRVHHVIPTDLPPGTYFLDIGLVSAAPKSLASVPRDETGEALAGCQRHCLVRVTKAWIVVTPPCPGNRTDTAHSTLRVVPAKRRSTTRRKVAPLHPPLFHVTHWKAGSQWVYAILRHLFQDRMVPPQKGNYHVLGWPVQEGRVYPTCYLERTAFEAIPRPADSRIFVVIRDLRDTLVSWYFSLRYSHPVIATTQLEFRAMLATRDVEQGLLGLLPELQNNFAPIQHSWLRSQWPLVKYEDLLRDTFSVLKQTLIERCQMPLTEDQVRAAADACRFDHLSGGRPPGDEDTKSHFRKGVAGDWKNHFTDRVKAAFKERFGDLLIATGYERDHLW